MGRGCRGSSGERTPGWGRGEIISSKSRSPALAASPAEGLAAAAGPRHREDALDDRVFVIAAARDGLHRDGIEPSVLHEALSALHANPLPTHHHAHGLLPVLFLH